MDQQGVQKSEIQVLFRFLRKYRRSLLWITLICAALSAGISFLIPKEYESTAVVFPPGALLLDQNVDNPNFGYDIEADRLLQILQSREIRDSVIRKFKLADYYNVNVAEQDWLSKVDRKYRKDLTFKRTSFMSIVINCQTRDAEMSSAMLNYVLEMADAVREKIYKQNVKLALDKTKDEYSIEKRICDSLYTYLQKRFRKEGISGLLLLAPNAQLNFDLAKLSAKGDESEDNELLGAEILKYRFHLDRQNEYEMKLRRITKMLEYPVSRIHVLDPAEPDYRKVFPMISLNVAVSAVLGFLLACFYFIVKPRPE